MGLGKVLAAAAAIGVSAPAAALTELLHDAEPNDAPHQAVPLDLPTEKDVVRVLGSLAGQDQDAYLLVVDLPGTTEDRVDVRLGRGAAARVRQVHPRVVGGGAGRSAGAGRPAA